MGPEFIVISSGDEKVYKVKGNESFTISNVNHNHKEDVGIAIHTGSGAENTAQVIASDALHKKLKQL